MDFICGFDKKNKITFINSKSVRHIKHSKYNKQTCGFDLCVRKNNTKSHIHINDNHEFIIFDFGDLYPYQFCIIPMSMLVQYGYISTNINVGKTYMPISYIDTNPLAWTNYYMNNYGLLNN